jgi:hypothetical protein
MFGKELGSSSSEQEQIDIRDAILGITLLRYDRRCLWSNQRHHHNDTLPAASLIALDKSNLIPSMISRTRLAYFFDRYLSNQIGIDMSQYKLSNKPGADHHPSSAIGSVSSASHHFDVEMMVTSQMHNNDRFVADEIGPALIIPPIEHEDR